MESRDHLAALAEKLAAEGLGVEADGGRLRVSNPAVRGCCAPHPAMTIMCRRREGFSDAWFYTGWQEPLAPVARHDVAVEAVQGWLSRHSGEAGRRSR
ncbi:hypothetical protein [Actinomadura kijaniata]|uniref:hypothetical protein n=1 Tax=Actinomadura kijaniata TaxID=46161 RepID=UPI000829CB0E|nr:hypothetical protein [Actinomadura kijaniata]